MIGAGMSFSGVATILFKAVCPAIRVRSLCGEMQKNRDGTYKPSALSIINSHKKLLCSSETWMERTVSSVLRKLFLGKYLNKTAYFEWLENCSDEYILESLLLEVEGSCFSQHDDYKSIKQDFLSIVGDRNVYDSFFKSCIGYFAILIGSSTKSQHTLQNEQGGVIRSEISCLKDSLDDMAESICCAFDPATFLNSLQAMQEEELEEKFRKMFEKRTKMSFQDRCYWGIVDKVLLDINEETLTLLKLKLSGLGCAFDGESNQRDCLFECVSSCDCADFFDLIEDLLRELRDKGGDFEKLKRTFKNIFFLKKISNEKSLRFTGESYLYGNKYDGILCYHKELDEICIVVQIANNRIPNLYTDKESYFDKCKIEKFMSIPENGYVRENIFAAYKECLKSSIWKVRYQKISDINLQKELERKASKDVPIFYYFVIEEEIAADGLADQLNSAFPSMRFVIQSNRQEALHFDAVGDLLNDLDLLESIE